MTIKRGRWAARIPGLRWGGQQVRRESSAILGLDPCRKDESAIVVLKGGRLIYSGIVKPPYPHPLDALSLLSEGGQLAPLMTRTGRSRLHLEPKIQNLRPPLSEEQKAMRNAIWEAVRRNLGLETTENSDKADTG